MLLFLLKLKMELYCVDKKNKSFMKNTSIVPKIKISKKSKLSENDVAKSWDKNAPTWAKHVKAGFDVYREYFNNPAMFKFIGNLKDKKVLDAGCGDGFNTRLLAKKGALVTGIDISKNMIKYSQQEEDKKPFGIKYEVASMSNLSFLNDKTFDVIVSFMALMDCSDYKGAIKELFRILKKDGELFFSVLHPCFLTKGYSWIEDENSNALKIVESNYFDKKSYVWNWKFSSISNLNPKEFFQVPCFPRTLSEYLNVLIDNGFVIKKMEEPRPPLKYCKKYPSFKRWRDHAAIFLYVHATK